MAVIQVQVEGKGEILRFTWKKSLPAVASSGMSSSLTMELKWMVKQRENSGDDCDVKLELGVTRFILISQDLSHH